MSDLVVANEIRRQLGGRLFSVMTGCKNFVGGDNYLLFSIPRNNSGANKCRITLNTMDTYDVEFLNANINRTVVKKEFNDVYCDQLQEIFTEATGLYTRM